jgi:indolepyruvate ferredoxin oxidoreductase beta subunit
MVAFDMSALADATGSALSAVLLGALAGSAALPFSRSAFEAAIRRGQVGVAASLAAFAAAFEAVKTGAGAMPPAAAVTSRAAGVRQPIGELQSAAERDFPGEARPLVIAGVERLNDYQDATYARDFLARLERFRDLEPRPGGGRLLAEIARQLALAMAYEDTIRVAELKIRSSRFARVRAEAQIADGQTLEIAEFFHPRTQEIADTLPAPLGRWLMRTGWARGLVDHVTRKGRIVKTTSISGFLLLYALSRLKPFRRRSLRFATEQTSLASWLALVADTAHADYALALEVARMRGLVKGYGDTHARGQMKFEKLAAWLPQLRGRSDGSALLQRLIKAALADEEGQALDKAIADLDASAGLQPASQRSVL